MFEDKILKCKDCGADFVFTAGEQEFYHEKGFTNEPLRCQTCREAHKKQIRANREWHEGTCASCGAPAKVPFKPTQDKPIYCSECYEKLHKES